MQVVPLQAVPNQACTITLGGQICQINVQQMGPNLFLSLYLANELVVSNIIAENLNPLIRGKYLGFQGQLAFCDNQGSSDPVYTGLGPTTDAHYSLLYLSPEELAT